MLMLLQSLVTKVSAETNDNSAHALTGIVNSGAYFTRMEVILCVNSYLISLSAACYERIHEEFDDWRECDTKF